MKVKREDIKEWFALSCPIKGLRFDKRTLELLDTDGDGHIRTDEVVAAIDFLEKNGERFEASEEKLAEVMLRKAELEKAQPPDEAKLKAIASGNALKAVEATIDAYFLPAEDAPFIVDEPVKELPLKGNVNVRYLDEFDAFLALCVRPVFGEDKSSISFREWKELKAKFPMVSAANEIDNSAMAAVVEEERAIRYKLYLEEFLCNFVSMDGLYGDGRMADFQMGRLRIDAREMELCFHVENEAAHSALSGKSNCFVIYLKLTRPSENATRNICAVVTAGTVSGLYVGRNGVFYDRDGANWEAVITKVVENQVSIIEAFWMPWRKLGEGVAETVKKFLGERQSKALAGVGAGTQNAQAGGAAMASSVAAIGIGVGMIGAAMASLMAVVSRMGPMQLVLSIVAVILVVSLPSAILATFKLRKRDLGAILNASGWAINRPMRLTMKRAAEFTKCAKGPISWYVMVLMLLVVVALGAGIWYYNNNNKGEKSCTEQKIVSPQPEAASR